MKKVRGVWLTNVASDVYTSEDKIKKAIELLASTGFNVVFPVVWNKGFTLYRSEVMRRYFGDDFIIDPTYSNRDPLAEIVEAAKAFKLKVIPWFEYGFAAAAVQKTLTGLEEFGKHILEKQSGFAAVNHSNQPLIKPVPDTVGDIGFKWMNALNPEVQAFMIELMVEVAQNYDVDGVQGDDRLPAFPVEGFDQAIANQFKTKHGRLPTGPKDEKWMKFRADILTDFLKELSAQIRQVGKAKGKEILISMAPHPRGFGFREALQDTKEWLEHVDMLHPQLYRQVFSGGNSYQTLLADELSGLTTAQAAKLSPGVLMKEGDYRISDVHLDAAVGLNRTQKLAGQVFFFFEGLRKPDSILANKLRDPLYAVNQKDDEGPDVFRIQKLLKDLGKPEFDPGDVDGIFGTKTETAVKNFQTAQSLTVDGKVGAKTLEKLGVLSLAKFGSLPVA